MSEEGNARRATTARRGLPRRPGERLPEPATKVADGTKPPAINMPLRVAQETEGTPKPRRTGLPRTAAAAVPTSLSSASEANKAADSASRTGLSSGGRRTGLPRPGLYPPQANSEQTTASPPEKPPTLPTQASRKASAQAPEPEPTLTRPLLRRPAVIVLLCIGLLLAAGGAVLFARWFVSLDFIQHFLKRYPGQTDLPPGAPVGLPAWLGWQHFLNAFFILLIIRTGWQVRTQKRPPAMWVRDNEGLIKTKNPPKKISLTLWAHLTFDALWLANGVVLFVLLLTTGQWMRVVPTTWEIFPNAISAALQYISMDWPTENGWVNYNSLQVLSYFVTIFIAAPLAALSGVRMSGAWPAQASRLNRIYPIGWARAIHFPVMLYFVLFVIVHVTLVFATGALRNLNHMYASEDSDSWAGFWIFFGSFFLMVASMFAARPLVLAPIAQLTGKVGR